MVYMHGGILRYGCGRYNELFLSRKSIAEMRICSCSDNFENEYLSNLR